MVKILSAKSLEALEKKVNEYEKANDGLFYFTEHSLSMLAGEYAMSITLATKDYH